MRKSVVLLFAYMLFTACGNNVSKKELSHLTGYWEIEEAIMPDGTKKKYTINPTIDYFEVKGRTGFRKKVMPQFDGSYRVNDLSEKITVTEKNGTTYLNYVTKYAKWQEEVVEISDEELVLKNGHNMEYHYKRPQPFSVK